MSAASGPTAQSVPGVLHFVPPNLTAFEPAKPLVNNASTNTILWIGGLGDTTLSVSYPLTLAQSLGPTWSLITATLSSSGLGWGVCDIAQDATEISKVAAYIRSLRHSGKLIIMGHSTGCQDCMHYLVGRGAQTRTKVDGIILQAPVSDRQAFGTILPDAHIAEANKLALEMVTAKRSEDALPVRLTRPVFGKTAVTARRWLDLASPGPNHAGADDMFSSDLSAERLSTTFGALRAATPLLILFGGSDESVPETVHKQTLVNTWIGIVEQHGGVVDKKNSGVIVGASHNLNGAADEVVSDLIARVLGHLQIYHSPVEWP